MIKKPGKQLSKYLRFSGAGIQMGLIIYLSYRLGDWLDQTYPNPAQVYSKIITLIGVFLAIYVIVKEALKLGRDNEADKK